MDLLKEFFIEAQEHISTAEEDILDIEQSKECPESEKINRLFRALHTIKGGATCVKLDSIKELAHALESVVGLIRDALIIPDTETTQLLLEGIDKLKYGICTNKGEIIGAEDTIIRLKQRVGSSQSNPIKKEERRIPALGNFNLGNVDAASLFEQGLQIFECTFDLLRECRRLQCAPKDIYAKLSSVGTILSATMDVRTTSDLPQQETQVAFLCSSMIDDLDILFPGLSLEPLFSHKYTIEDVGLASNALIAQNVQVSPAQVKPLTTAVEQTVRIPIEIIDKLMNLAGELVVVRNRNAQVLANGNMQELATVNQRLDVVTTDLQRTVMQTRMQPIGNVFNRFTRIVRDLSHSLNKEIELQITGADVELDKSIIDGIVEPLTHLVRNAADHGIESAEIRRSQGKPAVGHIQLKAFHQSGLVHIQVIDDGKGMDPTGLRQAAVRKGVLTQNQVDLMSDSDILNVIFLPGFSTASEITEVSGRGVGMDVVKNSLQKFGGVVEIHSSLGQGSIITTRLPLTLAIIPAIILMVEEHCFAIPQVNVREVVWLHGDEIYQSIRSIDDNEVYWLRGKMLPIIRLSKVLNIKQTYIDPVTGIKKPDRRVPRPDRRQKGDLDTTDKRNGPLDRRQSVENSIYIVVLQVGSDKFGVCVEKVVDTEEIVVKPLHNKLKASQVYAGVTVLGDGSTSLILDVAELAQIGGMRCNTTETTITQSTTSTDEHQKILVYTLGQQEHFALPLCLLMRVDEISSREILAAGGKEYLRFRNSMIPLVRMEKIIPGISPVYDADFMYVIIPKIGRPVGILAAQVIDIMEVESKLHAGPVGQSVIIGSQLIGGHATSLLDMCALIEAIEPGWLTSVIQTNTQQKSVLLVDDSSFYRSFISSYLKGIGLKVFLAENGKIALEIIETESIDVIVSDIEMPVMDGLELARRVKSDTNIGHISMLAISSMDEAIIRPRALDAGFHAFRPKSDLPSLGLAIGMLCTQPLTKVSV